MGRKKINIGNCITGCDKPIFCRKVCRACYGKIWYEEYEREHRGAKKHILKPIGHKVINTYGYVIVKIPSGKRVLEHRYVMELKLKRKLHRYEQVHHKNGNKKDNQRKNLELWIGVQPKGQRIKDLIIYAKWILQTYGSKT